MDTYFQHQAVFKERRREMLHKKWVENVALPLQQRIIEKVISYKPGKSQGKYEYCLKHPKKPVLGSITSSLNYDVAVFLFLLLFSSAVLVCPGHSVLVTSACCCSQLQV